jgi:hypothetical protein
VQLVLSDERRISLSFFVLVIVLCLMGYLKGLSVPFYMQPAIISFAFLFFGRFSEILTNRAPKAYVYNFYVLVTLLIIFEQFFRQAIPTSLFNEIGRLVFPVLIVDLIFLSASLKSIKQKSASITKGLIILLLVDLSFRLIESGSLFPQASRYELKVGGLIFSDSNFNGFIAGFLFLYCYLDKILPRKWFLLLLVIVFYSFSLSVWLAVTSVLALSIFLKIGNKVKKYLIGILFFLAFFLLIYSFNLIQFILSDGSFKTKLQIYSVFYSVFFGDNLHLSLFGVGFGNLKYATVSDYRSHSILGLAAEGGLIWLVATIIFWIAHLRNIHSILLSLYIFVVGVISLYPVAYLAPCYFLVRLCGNDLRRPLKKRRKIKT